MTLGGAEAAGGETPPPELEGGFENADLRAGLGIEVRAARPDVLRSVLALRDFYAGLTLSEKDEELIWRKRGLPHSACVAFGFKSSPRSNEKLLRGLSPKYTEDELVSAGLWKRDGEECRPQPQLCGWGMMGKDEWGWAHPILIPYFDEEGQVIALRPHKGNVPGERPRLFVATDCHAEAAPARAEGDGSTRVITEGEFKACAVYWVFGGKAGAAALPGISQAKNFLVMQELKSWLATGRRPERVVVAFDNEEKGDSRLPGFKADKRKRFDAEIWARYLAIVLKRECGEATVARLPDEWRDAKGKADWDGRLGAVMNAA